MHLYIVALFILFQVLQPVFQVRHFASHCAARCHSARSLRGIQAFCRRVLWHPGHHEGTIIGRMYWSSGVFGSFHEDTKRNTPMSGPSRHAFFSGTSGNFKPDVRLPARSMGQFACCTTTKQTPKTCTFKFRIRNAFTCLHFRS